MTIQPTHTQTSVDSVLEKTIKDIGIPPRPVIIDRIVAEMRKEEPDFHYLGHLIEADVSLSASLIKMANSPYFGFHARARSIHEALTMLGLNVTSRAIAGLSLRRAFPPSPRLERFWHASAEIAALAGWLARTVEIPKLRVDETYTYGLFRDCGIPVLLRRFPEYHLTLDRANNEAELSFPEIELQEFPVDHAMIGCLLAQDWWLPHEICLAIRSHHDRQALDLHDSGLPLVSRYMIAAGQTAEYIIQRVTRQSHTCEWGKLGESCMRLLDINEAQVEDFCTQAVEVLKTVER